MRIFISHTWDDKGEAQRIADSLAPFNDVWIDTQQLAPGDAMQASIDEALAGMDAVVLVWSAKAAQSAAVRAEIDSVLRLKRPLLPCLIDGTWPSAYAPIRDLLGIRYDKDDPKVGLFRIQAALVRLGVGGLDLETGKALDDLKSFDGFLQYLNDHRNRKQLGGSDGAEWALRAMQTTNAAFASLSKLRDEIGDLLKFMQDTLGRVEAAGGDRAQLEALLAEVRRHPRASSKELSTLAGFVEGKLASLPQARSKPQAGSPDFTAKVARAAGRQRAGAPASAAERAARELLEAYVRDATLVLAHFEQLAAHTQSPAVLQVAAALRGYLASPDDLIPDEANGILGLLDDAWLIHNTVFRCIQAGWFEAGLFPVDWQRIAQADELAIRLLPPHVRQVLDASMQQLVAHIAVELASSHASAGSDPRLGALGALLDPGAASSPASSGQPQSIDDVIFTIGDKMVHYGGR